MYSREIKKIGDQSVSIYSKQGFKSTYVISPPRALDYMTDKQLKLHLDKHFKNVQ